MWVSATILNAHSQEESGVCGDDIVPSTWICAIQRVLEAEGLAGVSCFAIGI